MHQTVKVFHRKNVLFSRWGGNFSGVRQKKIMLKSSGWVNGDLISASAKRRRKKKKRRNNLKNFFPGIGPYTVLNPVWYISGGRWLNGKDFEATWSKAQKRCFYSYKCLFVKYKQFQNFGCIWWLIFLKIANRWNGRPLLTH